MTRTPSNSPESHTADLVADPKVPASPGAPAIIDPKPRDVAPGLTPAGKTGDVPPMPAELGPAPAPTTKSYDTKYTPPAGEPQLVPPSDK
jgi:hypothetical protein